MARNSFEDRLQRCNNPLLKKLFSTMIKKQSNLCVAADFRHLKETLNFIDKCGKHLVVLKVHANRYKDADLKESLDKLHAKKREYDFLLFEDAKFYDGPEIVRGMYEEYVKYADLITFVPLKEDTFESLRSVVEGANLPDDEPRGCLAVVELSFTGAWCQPSHDDREKILQTAAKFPQVCVGIISQKVKVLDDSAMIKATPGVHLSQTTDNMGQHWNLPSEIMRQGTDLIIVGRGITSAPEEQWESSTCRYKEIAWQAYLDDLKSP